MGEIGQLLKMLKKHLKAQGFTYRDLALALNLSEPSVKRMFASQRFTLDRLVEISHFLGFTLAELTHEAVVSENLVHTLSEKQEAELVSDDRLLLVAICSLNHWTVKDIVAVYHLTEAECIQRLIQLDRLRLIALLPGNRVRLNVARDFDWRIRGPIRQFFRKQGLHDFLDSDFAQNSETMGFSHAMLTSAAIDKLLSDLRQLRQRFAELHGESLSVPLSKRRGVGLLMAMRGWEIEAFRNLRR